MRNAHAWYCQLWSARLHCIFPHYLIKDTIFFKKKKFIKLIMRILIFYRTFAWSTSNSKKNWERYNNFFCLMPPHVLVDFAVLSPGHGSSVTDFWGIIKNIYRSSYKVPVIPIRFWLIFKFLEKHSNVKFHEIPYGGSRVVPRGMTRRTDMTKLILDFRYFKNAPKNV